MTPQCLVSVISIGLIVVICTVLVFIPSYEDGIVGRIALTIMGLAAYVTLHEMLNGQQFEFLPHTLALQVGAALFMVRHAWRFVRWRVKGKGDWRGLLEDAK